MNQKLVEIRKKVGMTQEELAIKSGISRVSICEIETGKRETVRLDTLQRIASALGVSVGIFFTDDV